MFSDLATLSELATRISVRAITSTLFALFVAASLTACAGTQTNRANRVSSAPVDLTFEEEEQFAREFGIEEEDAR